MARRYGISSGQLYTCVWPKFARRNTPRTNAAGTTPAVAIIAVVTTATAEQQKTELR
jgi:hypothetical protein